MDQVESAARAKGQRLVELYRRGVGGERPNAGRLLSRHLKEHDLTLYDLDSSMPVTQDITVLDHWRESASLVARLLDDHDGEILSRLVDADDLTSVELQKVIGRLDLHLLAESRATGWAHVTGVMPDELIRAADYVNPDSLTTGTGSLAQRLLAASLHEHWRQTHPERLLRAADPLSQHLILGLVQGLTGNPGILVPEGVRAYLSAAELARMRSLMAQDLPALSLRALRAAQDLARAFATDAHNP